MSYYYRPSLLSVFVVDLFWDSAKIKVGLIARINFKATSSSFWYCELVKLSAAFVHI